jgi:hypothetical protein
MIAPCQNLVFHQCSNVDPILASAIGDRRAIVAHDDHHRPIAGLHHRSSPITIKDHRTPQPSMFVFHHFE